MKHVRIGIAANIGAGKSTLVERLKDPPLRNILLDSLPSRSPQAGVHVYCEDFCDEILTAFYNDPKKYALTAQLEFFNGRLTRHHHISKAHGIVLEDRTLLEDYHIFGKAQRTTGAMTEAEFLAYQRTYNLMTASIAPPDIIVYLRASVPTLLSRIDKRGRDIEKTISPSYLHILNGLYEEFIRSHLPCPLIEIDADIDFENNDEYFYHIATSIRSSILNLKRPYTTPGLSRWLDLPEVESTHLAIRSEQRLKSYLHHHPSLITLAGNIGLGKSTLAEILHGSLEIPALYENPLENHLLLKFLADKPRYAYDLQLAFLEMRSQQRQLAKTSGRSYVKDRSLPEDYLTFSRYFRDQGYLSSNQLDLLSAAYRSRCLNLPPADLIIVLSGRPQLAWSRILERNRQAEVDGGGWKYSDIEALAKLYSTYASDVVNMGFHPGAVLEIDVDSTNILNRIHSGYICESIYYSLIAKPLPETLAGKTLSGSLPQN